MFEWDQEKYFDPTEDGLTHINTYSKGRTVLGRMLSNFAYSPFVYEPYGKFDSVEGFWYWYLTGQKHEDLRTVSGSYAKVLGRKYESDRVEHSLTEETIEVMQGAIISKIAQNKELQKMLISSTLPLCHYYFMYGRVINPFDGHDWFSETLEDIRTVLKLGTNGV
ncbi:hypothetical protein SEPL_056 [Salmonella phage SE_PL]|nr:hypothetical protein CPT_Munch_371 [Salmonella phage Munch]EAZ2022665.1 hypothetical protein [Salmonella enterica]MCP0435610.1 hypothetical protein [Salmonella enterica subsp. enterica serovar Mbandaka]QCW19069.1 hypothetical protein 7t3_0549 [Salmonella phage 7t3]QIG62669.1 hypothetical protein SEPL_056 [Salmonella phage SE_PL]